MQKGSRKLLTTTVQTPTASRVLDPRPRPLGHAASCDTHSPHTCRRRVQRGRPPRIVVWVGPGIRVSKSVPQVGITRWERKGSAVIGVIVRVVAGVARVTRRRGWEIAGSIVGVSIRVTVVGIVVIWITVVAWWWWPWPARPANIEAYKYIDAIK